MGGIAFMIMLCVIISYSNKAEQFKTDNAILKRRNETLEERFGNETEQATTPTRSMTGVEILKTFAQSHQVTLTPAEDYENEYWELYVFLYQGGQFYGFCNKYTDEVLLRYAYFYSLPYSEDALIRILHLCHDYSTEHRFVKIIYTIATNDSGEQEIYLHLHYEMMGVPQAGLECLLENAFGVAREISEILNTQGKIDEQPAALRKPMSRNVDQL
jgi:hypothetical protein